MRSRSVLVLLSLLLFAAAPAEAGSKGSKNARQKKATAQKKAAARTKGPTPSGETHATGTIGGTRKSAKASGKLPRHETVVASGSGSASAPVLKQKAPQRVRTTQSRASTSQSRRESTVVTANAASTRSFDSSAAVAPRKKGGRIKRFFAGIAIVATLSLGAVGWQSADMNSKVGDAWNYVQTHVTQIFDGGHNNPTGGQGHKTDPKPFPPFPDPGPPAPVPSPDPGPSSQSPSGGHGHQTPHGPDTDHR